MTQEHRKTETRDQSLLMAPQRHLQAVWQIAANSGTKRLPTATMYFLYSRRGVLSGMDYTFCPLNLSSVGCCSIKSRFPWTSFRFPRELMSNSRLELGLRLSVAHIQDITTCENLYIWFVKDTHVRLRTKGSASFGWISLLCVTKLQSYRNLRPPFEITGSNFQLTSFWIEACE